MTNRWPLQEAKEKLVELIQYAKQYGPQMITENGVDAVVILSMDEFRQLEGSRPTLKDFLLSGPILSDADVDLINDRSRDI
jgi:prevent-host-death family protein